jgi:hypothetical protein
LSARRSRRAAKEKIAEQLAHASIGFYTSVAGEKFARVQMLTIDGLLNETQRAEHPDYEPESEPDWRSSKRRKRRLTLSSSR